MYEYTETELIVIDELKNQQDYDELFLALQWPEDFEEAKKITMHTNLTELGL